MNASSNTVTRSPLFYSVIRRLLSVWLPIVIVGGIIFWLSGGMPPASWLLLQQMLSRWNGLQATLGNTAFVSFAIVLLQCLFILLAWLILADTIWREIAVISALRAQQRIIALQEKLEATEHTPITLQSSPVVSRHQGVQLMPEKQEKNTGIKIVSLESDDQNNSFDVNEAVFELPSETEEAEVNALPVQPQEEEETIFLYGNPFEGELPEVFHYDMDLKRGVQNIQKELRGQQKRSAEESADQQDGQNKDDQHRHSQV